MQVHVSQELPVLENPVMQSDSKQSVLICSESIRTEFPSEIYSDG